MIVGEALFAALRQVLLDAICDVGRKGYGMGMKVYVINTSYNLIDRWIILPDGTPGRGMDGAPFGDPKNIPYCMPCLTFLIDHPDAGWILFDTGFDVPFLEEMGGHSALNPTIWRDTQDLVYQMGLIGVKPEDVKTIILSHLHPDHCGQVWRFPNATCYLPGEDYNNKEDPEEYYPFKEGTAKIVEVWDDEVELFEGVKYIKLPGHTTGHRGLLLNLEHKGRIVLPADAMYSQEILDGYLKTRRVPRNCSCKEQYDDTIVRLMRMREEEGITIVPTHDINTFKIMALFPDYTD